MQRVHDGLVTQGRKDLMSWRIVQDMLAAFYPYFSDAYKPIQRADKIEVLIRDTRAIILKAQELDSKMRSAEAVYAMMFGQPGNVCQVDASVPPNLELYDQPALGGVLRDYDSVALIVVPGLLKCCVLENKFVARGVLAESIVRHARAFTQTEIRTQLGLY
jgi:hypothetical protein